MAQLGSSSHQQDHAYWWGAGNVNQFARKLTFPSGGPWLVTQAGCWMTGKDTAATARIVVWNFSTGAILGKSAEFNLANEALGLGNSNSHLKSMETPFEVAGGTSVLVGYARDRDEAAQHDVQDGVTGYQHERATWPGSMSGYATTAYAVQGWIIYEAANSLPDAPTLSSPANAAVDITGAPTFVFTHNDDDGDACASYEIQVDNNSDFSSPIWDSGNQTSGISGNTITRAYGGAALSRGTTYYWRARTADAEGDGAWSSSRTFVYNALPTVTKNAPAASALGVVHNLSELALWTPGGTDAECQFKFTPSDTAGGSLSKYRLRIYNAASGTEGDASQVYDSGEVSLAMTSGALQTINVAFGLGNGVERWWTIKVYDGYEWSAESSRTAFKVRWAQGLWEFDTTAGSTNWSFASGTKTETVTILFRSATSAGFEAATGKSAFFTAIGSVPEQRYLQVLIRLTTDTAGTAGSLTDMTLSYYGTPSLPDGWTSS